MKNVKELIEKVVKMKMYITLIDLEDECNDKLISPYILDVKDFVSKSIGMDAEAQSNMEKRILQLEVYRLENELQSMNIEKEGYAQLHGEVCAELKEKLSVTI